MHGWSDAELALLGTADDAQIAAALGRTARAVRQMRYRVGIGRDASWSSTVRVPDWSAPPHQDDGETQVWFLTLPDDPGEGRAAAILADVLEAEPVPAQFYLSPNAADGMLRRARTTGEAIHPFVEASLVAASKGKA